jgi:hypothetical protein
VISSLGAVILSAFLAHYLSGRKQKNRSRSLVAMCLESLYVQSPAIENYFSILSGLSEGWSWTQATLPVLFGYSNRTKPFDIPFDKIRENILDLGFDLADMILKLEIRIRGLNGFLVEYCELYSQQSKIERREMLRNLEADKKVNAAIGEYVGLVASASKSARKQLFEKRKKIVVDWNSTDAKSHEVDRLLMEAARIQNE